MSSERQAQKLAELSGAMISVDVDRVYRVEGLGVVFLLVDFSGVVLLFWYGSGCIAGCGARLS